MYTGSVISQRSLGWLYFLVKPTSLHSIHNSCFSKYTFTLQDIPKDLFPWCCSSSSFSCFKVKYLSFGIFCVLLWSLTEKKKNPFSLPSLWKTTKAETPSFSMEWPGKCSKMINLREQIGRWLQNSCFPQTVATFQHTDTFESLVSRR